MSDSHAWFDISRPMKLSDWIKTFEAWKKTYGDVMAGPGADDVTMILTIPNKPGRKQRGKPTRR